MHLDEYLPCMHMLTVVGEYIRFFLPIPTFNKGDEADALGDSPYNFETVSGGMADTGKEIWSLQNKIEDRNT